MTCTICNIVQNPLDNYLIYEDDDCIAFLDHRPLFIGHTLLAPKNHLATIYDLPDALTAHLFLKAKTIGKAIETGMHAEGTFMAVNNKISQSIPHFHLHLVPRNKGDGLKGFFWPRTQYQSAEQKKETQQKIKKQLE